MIKIQHVETFVYRYPLKTPVQTSFGIMNDRPMVIVKLTDQDNVVGFGEIWCNYPACGAEHRANLVKSLFADLIYSHTFNKPGEVFELLTINTWVLCYKRENMGLSPNVLPVSTLRCTISLLDEIPHLYGNILGEKR